MLKRYRNLDSEGDRDGREIGGGRVEAGGLRRDGSVLLLGFTGTTRNLCSSSSDESFGGGEGNLTTIVVGDGLSAVVVLLEARRANGDGWFMGFAEKLERVVGRQLRVGLHETSRKGV